MHLLMDRPTPSLWLAVFATTVPLFAGCPSPCEALAERICNCEPDQIRRRTCINERVEAQRDLVPTEAETQACIDALDTCTCDALNENRTDLCGYTREASSQESAPSDGGA